MKNILSLLMKDLMSSLTYLVNLTISFILQREHDESCLLLFASSNNSNEGNSEGNNPEGSTQANNPGGSTQANYPMGSSQGNNPEGSSQGNNSENNPQDNNPNDGNSEGNNQTPSEGGFTSGGDGYETDSNRS